jgi:hypothetical protein
MMSEGFILFALVVALGGSALNNYYTRLGAFDAFILCTFVGSLTALGLIIAWELKSKPARDRRMRIQAVKELPTSLISDSPTSVHLGFDENRKTPIYLSDSIRKRHVHILGATGSGKTESVILNLLKQDVDRGIGAVILDAKGDFSFLNALNQIVPAERLRVFDLGSETGMSYDPLSAGSTLESAQRLFSSLTWSEEYYKSKAFSTIQRLFEIYSATYKKNPRIFDLDRYLQDPLEYAAITASDHYPRKLAEKDFAELSGLRDQIRTLCSGYLSKILSPDAESQIDLAGCKTGKVIYFRLQSLMSPQLVGTVGKLVINHLSFMAGMAHRDGPGLDGSPIIPVYLDEFASFACPEFADLISKARSAGFALHFSHQSIGDLTEVSEGFINRITDNAGTKIVLRINDPDSAEFFARSFGTRVYQKITQKLERAEDPDDLELSGEGSSRDAHQFRASPDMLKTLPTGVGAVLVAHGEDTPHGASSVFRIRFPRFKETELTNNSHQLPEILPALK